MRTQMERNWWALVLRGVAGVIFGLAAFYLPGLTLHVLVLLFGAYALVSGAFTVATGAIASAGNDRSWVLLLQGVAGMAAGLVAFFLPGITAVLLLYIMAGWAIATGILEIVAAIRLRRELTGEWLLVLSGLASVAVGVLLALRPGAGALALVWLVGAYAFVSGVMLIALGVRLRTGSQPPVRTRAAV